MVAKAINAIQELGFNSFEDYLCARTGKTLVDMAEELGINSVTFIAYHDRWMQAKIKATNKRRGTRGCKPTKNS